jgi:hypothetical protein
MGRILFFLLLALAIYIGWRMWRMQQSRPRGGAQSSDRGAVAERMVRCDVCGLNLPQSEALPAPGASEASDASDPAARSDTPVRWYCCEAHRRQGAAQR